VSDLRSFRFLFLPTEHDPDSFVRELGAEAFEQAVRDAQPLSRMLLDKARADADLSTPEGRARLLAQARPMWQLLPPVALSAAGRSGHVNFEYYWHHDFGIRLVRNAAAASPQRAAHTHRRAAHG
jgi:DNA primase